MADHCSDIPVDRRTVLQAAGTGVAGTALLSGTAVANDVEIVFTEQESDGDRIILDVLSADVDGVVQVIDTAAGENELFGGAEVSAGTDTEDFVVELDQPVPESQSLRVLFFTPDPWDDDAEVLAEIEAYVAVGEELSDDLGTSFVEADPASGFHYPYYLFSPSEPDAGDPILVEPNNTGTATDDFEQHRERAEQLVESGLARNLSEALDVPLLVPVFPRPRNDPVDGTHYVHQLDTETVGIEDGKLERVDEQLLAMVDHANERLADGGLDEKILLNGFSASGNFVDRFTVLHPDRVLSVTAGGLNGMALLPTEEYDGHTLPFHVGIADVEELTGEPVDLEALDEVNQFLYMGAEDDNDTIPYNDAWTEDELRQTALDVYGDDMIGERFPTCQEVYDEVGVDAQFRVYEDAGHTPRPAEDDILEFHERSIAGEDVSDFGERIGTTFHVDVTTTEPDVGESVEFDASEVDAAGGETVAYTWEFVDSENDVVDTAAGETIVQTFDAEGAYGVTLTVIDENGVDYETTFGIAVGDAEIDDEGPPQAESESTDDVAGFGLGAALAGLAGGAFLANRRSTGSGN